MTMNVGRYTSAVARELRDLPRAKRRAIVADLRAHLAEFPPGDDLVARLGPPAAYAVELRRSSGLPAPVGLRSRLRRIPLLLRILVPTVVVLLVAAVLLLRTSDVTSPLDHGNAWLIPGTSPSYEFGDQANIVLNYQHGREYDFAFKIANTGHLAVTVDEVIPPHLPVVPLQIEEMRLGPRWDQGLGRVAERFHSFTLDPGEQRAVFFYGVFAFCDNGNGNGGVTSSFDSVRVRFHVLGILSGTQEITMERPIAVPIPKSGSPQCPVPPAADNSPGTGGPGASMVGIIVAGRGYEVTVVPDVAPPAQPAEVLPPTPCQGTPVPRGMRAEPFYLNVVADDQAEVGQPIDLRLTSAGAGSILVESTYGGRCHAAAPLTALSGQWDDPTVVRGLAIVPASPCPVQKLHVAATQGTTGTQDEGDLRFYVPC
jgi:hypothetical protein